MIRHYEDIGLLAPSHRNAAGYRVYQERDLHMLGFIRRAREFGFSLDQIRQLLSLWQDQDRASADVKALAQQHIEALSDKIAALIEMRASLQSLADACSGDRRPDCPILSGLAQTRGKDCTSAL